MKNVLKRPLAYSLTIIGFILGFSSKVVAQYGAWVASYKINGNIKSEICAEAIRGIQVSLVDEHNNTLTKTTSDEDGHFYIRYFDDYYTDKFTLKFSDVDGIENNGDFENLSKTITLPYTSNYNVSMKHKTTPPCLSYQEDKISQSEQIPLTEDTNNPNTLYSEQNINNIENNLPESVLKEQIQDIVVFPNPTHGSFTISYTSLKKGQIFVSLFSGSGQLVLTESRFSETGINTICINKSGLAAGNYLLTIRTEQNFYSRNIIIE